MRKRSLMLDAVPETVATTPLENFAAKRKVGMTFNMPESWHKHFKMTPVQEGISMRDLLFRCSEEYRERRR